ncbi:hypothetical protein BKA61DRAFT_473338 [Leptodontidium sp. MPI-SDFR-AT-0119]|nr:hypothetical protein BKA61DRAFT_473338 [Leptodontidium sp. MPI-SDFR-AT-0119]
MNPTCVPVTATLSHLSDDPIYKEEMPYEIWADNVADDTPRTNIKLNIFPDCALTDVRTLHGEKPALDSWGFGRFHQSFPYETGPYSAEYVNLPREKQLDVLEKYLETMSGFLREQLGCEKVVCWDWRVRSSKMTASRTSPNIYSLKQEAGQDIRSVKINSSHLVDGSPQWMQKVVSKVITDEEAAWAETGKYRTRVLTVWRPLVDIVQTDPLVYCDTWTVTDSDLDIVQKVMNDTVEESMYLKPRKEHQWYWMSNQTRDDVVIMTVWDSKRPLSRSAAVPHCAMVLPEHPPGFKPRESIELRFVVWNSD